MKRYLLYIFALISIASTNNNKAGGAPVVYGVGATDQKCNEFCILLGGTGGNLTTPENCWCNGDSNTIVEKYNQATFF